jgi:O-antigen/teichoic acid export membrane protein
VNPVQRALGSPVMASHDPTAEAVVPGARPRRTVIVLGAAVVSGIAGYLVLVLTARHLDPAENADFLVFWAALFSVFGVLVGIATETTRAVFAAESEAARAGGARVVPVAASIGVATGVVLGVSALWWGSHLFGDGWTDLLPVLLVGVVLFAVHCGLAGAVAGRSEWDHYAALVAAESTVRVLAIGLVAVGGASVLGFAVASSLATGTWLLFVLVSSRFRRAMSARADVTLGPFLARILSACSAAAASALLLVGFPVLLRATTPDVEFATAAPLILAVSLSRAPLLVPLGAYQTVAVTKVMAGGLRTLFGPAIVVVGATLVGALLAYPLGPAVLSLLNPDYEISGSTFSLLVVAAGLVGLLTLSGAASLALEHHTAYVVGWIAATAVTIAVLLLPGPMETRAIVALITGPLVGMAIHLLSARR